MGLENRARIVLKGWKVVSVKETYVTLDLVPCDCMENSSGLQQILYPHAGCPWLGCREGSLCLFGCCMAPLSNRVDVEGMFDSKLRLDGFWGK